MGVWNRFFVCDKRSNWTWSDIARFNSEFFKIINQKYIQKTDMDIGLCILDPASRGPYEITGICLSFTALIG